MEQRPANIKEEKLKEVKKELTEVLRRQVVAASKSAGKEIEDIERLRKKPSVSSLRKRIKANVDYISNLAKSILSPEIKLYIPPDSTEIAQASDTIDTYKSIREDFKDIIGNDKLKKLFPERDTHFKSREELLNVLISIIEQESQISLYLLRV